MDDGELLALLTGVRTTSIRVGRISPYVAGKIGSNSNIVLLSPDTVAKQESKHRQRDLLLYRLAETVITKGELFRVSDYAFVAAWRSARDERGKTKIYKAFVKATKNGREVYLQSIHRTTEGRVSNIRRTHKAL